MTVKSISIGIVLFLQVNLVLASSFQNRDSLTLDTAIDYRPKRGAILMWSEGFGAVGTLSLLSYAWYRDFGTTNFRLFNDFNEWRGMDKIGHAITAYYIADYVHQTWAWAGLKPKHSILIGGISSYLYLTTIEVLDGYSAGWGFSIPDALMNTAGVLAFGLQNYLDPKKNIQAKFSFVLTEYRNYRPELLGSNFLESIIKDYNGQSYWLSFNLQHWTGQKKIPAFLNIALGYGAGGMLGGKNNPSINSAGLLLPDMQRYSRFLLSGDIQWTNIKTKNVYLKFLLKALSFYKLPFPTLEYNSKGEFRFFWIR